MAVCVEEIPLVLVNLPAWRQLITKNTSMGTLLLVQPITVVKRRYESSGDQAVSADFNLSQNMRALRRSYKGQLCAIHSNPSPRSKYSFPVLLTRVRVFH